MKKLLCIVILGLFLIGNAFGYTTLNQLECKIINDNVNDKLHKDFIYVHIASYITGRNYEKNLDVGINQNKDMLYKEFMEWCNLYPEKNSYEVLEIIYEKLLNW